MSQAARWARPLWSAWTAVGVEPEVQTNGVCRMLQPDARDLATLLFTWQSRFVSTAQLRRAFWEGAAAGAAARRLRHLRQAGLLGQQRFPWLSERLLYFSSRAGNQALADVGLLGPAQVGDVPRRPEALSPALRHDLGVVDLRLALEESGADGRTWISDHELRRQARAWGRAERVPDGVFDYSLGQRSGQGVLEYERATYRQAKVPALLARLRDLYERRTLFIVTQSPSRVETFRAWAAACGVYSDAPELIAFSHYAAVAKDGLEGGLVDLRGRPWPVAVARQPLAVGTLAK